MAGRKTRRRKRRRRTQAIATRFAFHANAKRNNFCSIYTSFRNTNNAVSYSFLKIEITYMFHDVKLIFMRKETFLQNTWRFNFVKCYECELILGKINHLNYFKNVSNR